MKFLASNHYRDFSSYLPFEYSSGGNLSIGTAKSSIQESALKIIKAHKNSCKKLIELYESGMCMTPDAALMIIRLEKRVINAIESDLSKIDLVYYYYTKCLYKFIIIVKAKTRHKITQQHKFILIERRNSPADYVQSTNGTIEKNTININANHMVSNDRDL